MKTSTLIYGVSLGAAFFLTGINILADFISFEIKISVGMIFVVFGLLLSIITLAWYISYREDKMRNNKIGIGEQKYMLIGMLIGLLEGFLGSMFAGTLLKLLDQDGTILALATSGILFVIIIFVFWRLIFKLDKSERKKEEEDNVEKIMEGKG